MVRSIFMMISEQGENQLFIQCLARHSSALLGKRKQRKPRNLVDKKVRVIRFGSKNNV